MTLEVELLAIAELYGGIQCLQRRCSDGEAGVLVFVVVLHEVEPEAERESRGASTTNRLTERSSRPKISSALPLS